MQRLLNNVYKGKVPQLEGVSHLKPLRVAIIVAVVTSALIALFFVRSSGIEVQYEYSFHVTSNTTLWNPGTHHFSVTGDAHILSPIDQTFPVEGEGTATYTMVGV